MRRRASPPAKPAYHLVQPHLPGQGRVALDQLRLSQRGVKRHPESQFAKLEASIRTFGFVSPILVDANNEVISGEARLIAARRLGLKDAPVVRVTHLTPGQIRAYRIADNRLAELGAWDEEVVCDILAELPSLDIDPQAIGFEIAEVDARLVHPGTLEDREEDHAPTLHPVVRLGDLFIVGDHRVLCGDARCAEDCARLMDGRTASVCISDPPYNVRVVGHVLTRRGKRRHGEFAMASGEMSSSEFVALLTAYLRQAIACLGPGALIYTAMDGKGISRVCIAAEAVELEFINLCVWAKENAGMGSFYRSQTEFFIVHRVPGASHRNNIQLGRFGRNRSNLWSYQGANSFGRTRDEDLAMHPTVKPTPLIEDILKDCTKRGDIAFDAFAGSGTTMIAAQRCGRQARLMEIDPRYVETALDRYHRMFGVEAVHVETGLTLSQLREARRGPDCAQPKRLPYYPGGAS